MVLSSPGSPAPWARRFTFLRSDEFSISISRRRKRCWLSLGILKSPVKGKGGTDWHRPPVRNIPRTGTGNCANTSKKDLISEPFFVITSGNQKSSSNTVSYGQVTAFSGKCLSRKGFRPPRHRGKLENLSERSDQCGTHADSRNSCRKSRNRGFFGIPNAPVVRPSGGRAFTHSRLIKTSCQGFPGHRLNHSFHHSDSQSCATPLFR